MRSIVFNGVDFSEFCSAEVVEKAALPIIANTMAVPGRVGALLVSGRIPPRAVRVRLFMDAGYKPGTIGQADIRHRVYYALASTGGGTLRLPDEPEFEYRDVVCADAGAWSSLFEDGHGDVEFALLDPVAYGMERVERGASFEVGGTWPTWPTFELVASAGSAVQVSYGGRLARIERSFASGEVVHIDCEREVVTIDGADARADMTLASDLSTFPPGACDLSVTGCASFVVRFRERWL
ncbi:Phage-related protein [uncultured Collinsella sp.]|nr:Phage-related protein [uncultured Collinsella sp.]